MNRESIDSVLRSLRRVNLQGSLFGHTVAVRFGLSESDIEALEVLIDTGSSTAGALSDLMGLTTGAVTRVIDRLEQAGYVRRVPDPADRRRVIVEVVPENVAGVQATLGRVGDASTDDRQRCGMRRARLDQIEPRLGRRRRRGHGALPGHIRRPAVNERSYADLGLGNDDHANLLCRLSDHGRAPAGPREGVPPDLWIAVHETGAMPAPVSIGEVVDCLQDRIDVLPAELDHRRIFIQTYQRTTRAVAAAVETGFFEDPDWVVRWDVAFADLFLVAHDHDRLPLRVGRRPRCPGPGASPSPPARNCRPWRTCCSG